MQPLRLEVLWLPVVRGGGSATAANPGAHLLSGVLDERAALLLQPMNAVRQFSAVNAVVGPTTDGLPKAPAERIVRGSRIESADVLKR